MALPDLGIMRVQRCCAATVLERARHRVRVECEIASRHLTDIAKPAFAMGPPVSELADKVLPLIRTRADVYRWATANDHGQRMHAALA